jgi:hypothetical protein
MSIARKIDETIRRGWRSKQLLGDFNEAREYCKLTEEVLDHTVWKTRFVKSYGHVVR